MLSVATATIIGAAIAAGSALASSAINKKSVDKANKINQENAEKQFQEQQLMNRNQYQIQAADMQKAGINPAMGNMTALSAGTFNSSQSGVDVSNDLAPITEFASSALQSSSQIKQTEMQTNSAKEVAKIQSQTARDNAVEQLAETKRHNEQMEDIQRQIALNNFSIGQQNADTNSRNADTNALNAQINFNLSNAQIREISSKIARNDALTETDLFNLYKMYQRGGTHTGVLGSTIDTIADALGHTFNRDLVDFNQFQAAYWKGQALKNRPNGKVLDNHWASQQRGGR